MCAVIPLRICSRNCQLLPELTLNGLLQRAAVEATVIQSVEHDPLDVEANVHELIPAACVH